MPTYLDVHVLQTVPPSNLNRDDAGSPKQAVYGGARRARVSSQAWKRATRIQLADGVPTADRSSRTKRISSLLAERLVAGSTLNDEQASRLANKLLETHKITSGKKETDTAYLLFFGKPQLDGIVATLSEQADELAGLDDKPLTEALKGIDIQRSLMTGHPLDVALFGRMVADIPAINVDAATQVAHALSTHAIDIEFDYFTAIDDEQQRSDDEGSGAAMIGTVEFNSATLYRYATLGLNQLVENLGAADGQVADGAARFVDAFARSMPTGHRNSFAHGTLPSFVAVIVRDDQPVNLVSAFEKPVWSTTGYMAPSIRRLAEEQLRSTGLWGAPAGPILAMYDVTAIDGERADDGPAAVADAFGPSCSFNELLAGVRTAVDDRVASKAA
jgi:CRISPR system Cascade subunit CasC